MDNSYSRSNIYSYESIDTDTASHRPNILADPHAIHSCFQSKSPPHTSYNQAMLGSSIRLQKHRPPRIQLRMCSKTLLLPRSLALLGVCVVRCCTLQEGVRAVHPAVAGAGSGSCKLLWHCQDNTLQQHYSFSSGDNSDQLPIDPSSQPTPLQSNCIHSKTPTTHLAQSGEVWPHHPVTKSQASSHSFAIVSTGIDTCPRHQLGHTP